MSLKCIINTGDKILVLSFISTYNVFWPQAAVPIVLHVRVLQIMSFYSLYKKCRVILNSLTWRYIVTGSVMCLHLVCFCCISLPGKWWNDAGEFSPNAWWDLQWLYCIISGSSVFRYKGRETSTLFPFSPCSKGINVPSLSISNLLQYSVHHFIALLGITFIPNTHWIIRNYGD